MIPELSFMICFMLIIVLMLYTLLFFVDAYGFLYRYHEWDFWVSSWSDSHNQPVLWTKHLFYRWHYRIDLHAIIYPDKPNFYHSHPAWAIRFVFANGYIEEVYDRKRGVTYFVKVKPWTIGLISPRFTHRVHALLDKKYPIPRPSFSLWFRGPIVAPVYIGEFQIQDGEPVYIERVAGYAHQEPNGLISQETV